MPDVAIPSLAHRRHLWACRDAGPTPPPGFSRSRTASASRTSSHGTHVLGAPFEKHV